MPPAVISTARLILRELTPGDAEFILTLVNDADWLRYIGDRGVRTLDDAMAYIERGPRTAYATHGFGLYGVALRDSRELIGMCGLIKRESLPDVDIGFAFLPAFRSHGYAYEAAAATLQHAATQLGLTRIVAIVSPDNERSATLLRKLGMRLEGSIRLTDDTEEVRIYGPMANSASQDSERLFSYGTLQLEAVQLSTFGRRLDGVPDAMPGYTTVPLDITDESVVAVSGSSQHTMARYTGRDGDAIAGMVFAVSTRDIECADRYEVAAVKRVQVTLESGAIAWVYVDAATHPS